jgi:hypothetical protein
METPVSRRALLGAGSAAVALSVAGCSSLGGSEGESGGTEPREATFVVAIDEEEIQAARDEAETAQQEIQGQLQAGEINRTEAQRRFQETQADFRETQQELLSEAIDALESHAEDTEGLSITDSVPEAGVALGEGDGGVIVDALALDSVRAIVDAAEFESYTESESEGQNGTESESGG